MITIIIVVITSCSYLGIWVVVVNVIFTPRGPNKESIFNFCASTCGCVCAPARVCALPGFSWRRLAVLSSRLVLLSQNHRELSGETETIHASRPASLPQLHLRVQQLRRPTEAGVVPLGGASGNMPVIGSCRVSDGSPAGGKVRVQQKILVSPDVV